MTSALVCTLALYMVASVARLANRITTRTHSAIWALGCFLDTLRNVLWDHNPVAAALTAASCAIWAWLWWNNGGGDDTKRRLRAWVRRFRGVRRTAPAA
jgi:hypothetical protein